MRACARVHVHVLFVCLCVCNAGNRPGEVDGAAPRLFAAGLDDAAQQPAAEAATRISDPNQRLGSATRISGSDQGPRTRLGYGMERAGGGRRQE